MRHARLWTLAALLLACLPCLTSRAEDSAPQANQTPPAPQQPAAQPQTSTESYRLRITNTLYGPVEVSSDQGATWLLIGRVLHPAVDIAPGAADQKAIVLRSSAQGVALGVSSDKFLRLVPDSTAARRDPTAITVNATTTSPLFQSLLPPIGSPVQQVVGRTVIPMPEKYFPQDADVLLITVTKPDLPTDKAAPLVKEAAEKYQQTFQDALKKAGKKPTSGTLTVNANVPPSEKANIVTFYLDGNVVGILNSPPYSIRLNTTIWTNGEHVVEARALDASGNTVTRKKVLVVVNNPPQLKP